MDERKNKMDKNGLLPIPQIFTGYTVYTTDHTCHEITDKNKDDTNIQSLPRTKNTDKFQF